MVILLPEITLDEGPSLETSGFCLFISGSNITTQRWKTDDDEDGDDGDDDDHGGQRLESEY